MGTQNGIQKVETHRHDSLLERGAALIVQSGGNMTPDHLEKLLDVHLRDEANEARKAYVVAMAAFKADPPKIAKDRHVEYLKVKYNHATLANVTTTINTALSKHGLTAAWITDQVDKQVKVTCTVTHILGHSESTSLTADPDTTGSKNPIQAIGSTVTYLQRYTILAITGLATDDQDDDGKGAGKQGPSVRPPTDEEWEVIAEVCKKIPTPEGKRVDPKKVAAICYESKQAYPYEMSAVNRIATWLADMNRPELFIPIPKDEFDEHVENFIAADDNVEPDHLDQPDNPAAREAEATAAAKFGEENDQVPCRFLCNECNHEYDKFLKIDQCPKCLRKNVLDRQEKV